MDKIGFLIGNWTKSHFLYYNRRVHANNGHAERIPMKKVLSILLILIILFGAGGYLAFRFLNRGSGEVSSQADGLAFISDGISQDSKDFALIDGQYYLSLDYIQKNLDETVYYDKNEGIVSFTNKQGLKRLKIDEDTFTLNGKTMELRDPVIQKDDTILIPTEAFIHDYPVEFRYHKESNKLNLDFTNVDHAVGSALKGTLLREKANSSSPYITRIQGDEKIIFYGEEGDFYRVRLENGYGGYLLKSNCKVDFRENKFKGPFAKNEEAQVQEPLHLTWDYIYGKENQERINAIQKIPGVDIIVPTWFSIQDKEGTVYDRGNVAYVNKYQGLGIDVWGYIDNSFDPEITHASLSSTAKRDKVLDQVMSLLRIYHMKGVNVDFEHVNLEDGLYITQFVQELKALCYQEDIKVSVDVTPQLSRDPNKEVYNREKLAKAADYIVLMAYDQYWSSSEKPGSVAEYKWVESHLNTLFRSVPKEKIILGVPLYTRLWTQSNGKWTSKNITMGQAGSYLASQGQKAKWDDVIKQYVLDTDTEKIWLENSDSLKYKAGLVPKYGLRGLASWRKGLETPDVWTVLDQAIHLDK